MPTLYHWNMPRSIEEESGWLERKTGQRFAGDAAMAAVRLADRIGLWITLNEPFIVTAAPGYAPGIRAPVRCPTTCRRIVRHPGAERHVIRFCQQGANPTRQSRVSTSAIQVLAPS